MLAPGCLLLMILWLFRASVPTKHTAVVASLPSMQPAANANVLFRAPPRHPLATVRRAAASYFPTMFGNTSIALPAAFEPGRNPCWAQHCLPAFLIIGVYQSGVRDLYSRLLRHPDIVQRSVTAASYYSQVHPDWGEYVRSLDNAVASAREGKLLGEASAVTFHFVWVHQVACHLHAAKSG